MPGKVALIHPFGNPFAREASEALWERQLLATVYTGYNYAGRWQESFPGLHRELSRRAWLQNPDIPYKQSALLECPRMLLQYCFRNRSSPRLLSKAADYSYCYTDWWASRQRIEHAGVYAYEDGALQSFRRMKARAGRCIYDLPIPFTVMAERVHAEEAANFPQFKPVFAAFEQAAWKRARKEEELALASTVVVASSLAKASLLEAGVASERIQVIPYGVNLSSAPRKESGAEFTLLFVGRIGPRKGVHYLLQAWKELALPRAKLVLVGINEFPAGYLESFRDWITYIPSLPQRELSALYRQASALVLPSLLEGFGLVLLEAMAEGVPIIASTHTAAVDILEEGREGYIVPIRSVEALKTSIESLYLDPEKRAAMGLAAYELAAFYPWSRYRESLGAAVGTVLSSGAQG